MRSRIAQVPLNVSPRVDVPQLLGLGASTGQNACSLKRTVWNVLDIYILRNILSIGQESWRKSDPKNSFYISYRLITIQEVTTQLVTELTSRQGGTALALKSARNGRLAPKCSNSWRVRQFESRIHLSSYKKSRFEAETALCKFNIRGKIEVP